MRHAVGVGESQRVSHRVFHFGLLDEDRVPEHILGAGMLVELRQDLVVPRTERIGSQVLADEERLVAFGDEAQRAERGNFDARLKSAEADGLDLAPVGESDGRLCAKLRSVRTDRREGEEEWYGRPSQQIDDIPHRISFREAGAKRVDNSKLQR